MVDGINIANSHLSGAGETAKAVPRPAVTTRSSQETQPTKPPEATQEARIASENVSSAIAKSTDKRFSALSTGNVQDFLQAAEKFIDATLPSKPPGTKLRIDFDDDSGRFVYKGVDIKTGDVVIQFPSEEILKLIAFSREREGVEGIVVDEEA